MMRALLYRFNPAVPNRWLLLLAGIIWTGVGTLLCLRAIGWIEAGNNASSLLFVAAGAIAGVVWNRAMFANIARRNVTRISRLPEKVCIFAFTAWRGYAMIAGMISLGIFLRGSSIPRDYLATLYAAMGGALLLSSFIFYKSFWVLERTTSATASGSAPD